MRSAPNMSALGRASATSCSTSGPTAWGSRVPVTWGPRCHPSATARVDADDVEDATRDRTRLDAGQPHDDRGDPAGRHGLLGLLVGGPEAQVGGEAGERTRGDGVDGDAVPGELVGGDDRERGDARLGRAVVGLADVAVDARRRRGVDEAPVDLLSRLRPLAPVGGGEVGGTGGALQVDLDDRVPLGLAHVGEHAVTEDAGVVDQHVEAAERVDRLGDQRARRRPSR